MSIKHNQHCPCPRCHGMTDEEMDASIEGMIEEYGWAVMAIFASDEVPSFCYSVGLTNFNHPEIIVFGLPQKVGQRLINDMGCAIKDGMRYEDGETDMMLANLPARYHAVKPEVAEEYFTFSKCRAEARGQSISYLQMVWSDTQGKFPDEEGFEEKFRANQPLL